MSIPADKLGNPTDTGRAGRSHGGSSKPPDQHADVRTTVSVLQVEEATTTATVPKAITAL